MSLAKTFLVFLGLLICGTSAFAGGYQLNEHGARAMAMGGAYVAQASDGSAIYFNAAGLAFQSGFKVMVGTTIIMPSGSFKPTASTKGSATTPYTTETKMADQTFTPINAYITYAFNNGLVVGIGVYNGYGLGTEWPINWDGRQMAVKADLMTWYINPTVAYKFSDQFAVGAGISYVSGSVKLKQRVTTLSNLFSTPLPTPASNDGTVALDGTGNAINWNVGVMYKPTADLSIGVSYRALTKIDFSGTATFTDMGMLGGGTFPPVGTLPNFFPGGTGKTTLPFPSNLFAGIAYNITKDFTVEADFQYVGWSAYDQLVLDIPTGPSVTLPAALGGSKLGPYQGASTLVKNWDDAYLIRVGGEYRMDKLALRAGFIYDKTPQPDAVVEPMLPDANRIEGTVGFGYDVSTNVNISATYQFISFSDRNATVSYKTALPVVVSPATTISGAYSNSANLFGVNVGLSF
jgi:long-chain fatty acid transport protein